VTQEQLADLTISKLSPRIKSQELLPVDVTKLFLERIERLNPAINAYVTLTSDQALSDAKAAEKEILGGNYRGPLHGIPVSIKDNIATKGVRTTAGSKVLADWVPDFDATVVTRLKEAGAIILGKTNMHEWASGGTTINPFYGTTCNPWDLKRIPGGSSGGSAAAVAAGMCLASIGTDNAGSVRMPASYCGVVGLKATYGRVSRFGDVAGTGAFSSDHFGTFTKTVEDCTLVLETIAGHDPKDPLSARESISEYSKSIGQDVRGLRLGLIEGYFDELMVGQVKDALTRAVGVLESLGMNTVTVSIPHMNLIPPVQTCTSRVENVAAHVPHMKKKAHAYSPYLLHRQICALTIPAATYVTAQRVRRMICDEFDEALNDIDVLVTPTVALPAETIEECNNGFVEYDGKQIRLDTGKGSLGTLCTIPFNVTGLPAISVPCGFSTAGLPIGMQIAGAPFQEDKICRVADAYERAAGWSRRKPELLKDVSPTQ
jgi:aspartyl-tRNA(Asn)/glutamyl-tRNA(Gln) amidotransferase subunit A